jgi:O-antigen ligase
VVMLLQTGVDFRRIVWVLLLAGIFMGSISTYQYLTGAYTNDFFGFGQAQIQNIVGQTSDYRVSGPVGDANFYAQIMVTLVPLALERLWNERNLLLRLVAGYALAVCLVTIIATFSRGGFLALIVMLVALLVVRRPRFSHLLVAAGVVVLFIEFAPTQYLERLGTLMDFLPGSDTTLSEVSLRGRTSENTVGWLILGDHPILGVGLNNYPYYYLSYARDLGLESRLEARAAHSLYLQIAAEQGIVGLAAFGLLMFGVFHSLQFAYRRLLNVGKLELSDMTMAYGIGLMGYLTAAIFLHNAYPRFFWLLMGIAFALREVAKTESAPATAITAVESAAVHE